MNKLIRFKSVNDNSKGTLAFFETNKDIPFEIKRIYFTYGVELGTVRGMHAHKKLKQLLWCPYGEIEIVIDDGKERKSYLLDSADKGLLLLDGSWREIYWKVENSVLCVAASDYYTENDYIRDYNEFTRLVEMGYWANEN
jgi:dTDP-4-dehydrorhamnose 3,5-epimerase-like enzyme